MSTFFKTVYQSTAKDILNPKPALMYLVAIAAQWSAYFMVSHPDFFKGENPISFDLYWPTVIGTAIMFLVACSKSYFSILAAIISSVALLFLGHAIEAVAIVILIYIAFIFTLPTKSNAS